MEPLLLSVGNKFWAEEKGKSSVDVAASRAFQTQASLHKCHRDCCFDTSCELPEKFYLRWSQMPVLLPRLWHACLRRHVLQPAIVCHLTAVHFSQSGIPSWHCGSVCLLFVVKRGKSRARAPPTKASVRRPCKSKPNERGVKPLRILSGESRRR